MQVRMNGNVKVTLYPDGTKVREWDGEQHTTWPESLDVKVTDYCNLDCQFCHEGSTPQGKHADLRFLRDYLSVLPPGTEIAIGGGNPMAHEGLLNFLIDCRMEGLICNMTLHGMHVAENESLLLQWLRNGTLNALGISGLRHFPSLDNYHIVHHVIAGVHDINHVIRAGFKRVLVLGYKSLRRGAEYQQQNSIAVDRRILSWKNQICDLIAAPGIVSFDNLAIEQLNLCTLFTDNEWASFYQGDDGTVSYFIDGIDKTFAVSSTRKDRFPLTHPRQDMITVKQVCHRGGSHVTHS